MARYCCTVYRFTGGAVGTSLGRADVDRQYPEAARTTYRATDSAEATAATTTLCYRHFLERPATPLHWLGLVGRLAISLKRAP